VGAATDAELVAEIRAVIEAVPFYRAGLPHVWARLPLRGVRAAARWVRRLMREHGLSAPNRPPQRPANDHGGKITTGRVDQSWATDMAQTMLASGARGHVFDAVDSVQQRVHRSARRGRREPLGRRWSLCAKVSGGTSHPPAPISRSV
jgi:hypothetical protein